MKKLYGGFMAWSFYCLGDILSIPMWWSDFYAEHMYEAYNWLMLKSAKYQEDYELEGPWEKDTDGDLLVACLEKEEEDAKS